MKLASPLAPLHVFRIWNPRTGEVYATPGASDEALAVREVRKMAPRYPEGLVQVYRAGRWRPWLTMAEG